MIAELVKHDQIPTASQQSRRLCMANFATSRALVFAAVSLLASQCHADWVGLSASPGMTTTTRFPVGVEGSLSLLIQGCTVRTRG